MIKFIMKIYEQIKSKYILKQIFDSLQQNKIIQIIKYNKSLQNKLEISINDYIEYSQIEIEIIPTKNLVYTYNHFINITNEKEEKYYHIYFNNDKKEIKKTYITDRNQVFKIKIIIDYNVKSFSELFKWCDCVEKINFIKFNRKDINDMSFMFFKCLSLKEINLTNFKTDNVTFMNAMFCACSSLKELDLSSFNTDKVINMGGMFYECSLLQKLNISNFNFNNSIDIKGIFYGCSSLRELNISNIKSLNIENLNIFISECPLLLRNQLKDQIYK